MSDGPYEIFVAVSAVGAGTGWAWSLVVGREVVAHDRGALPGATVGRAEATALIAALSRLPADARSLRVHLRDENARRALAAGGRRAGARDYLYGPLYRSAVALVGGRAVEWVAATPGHAEVKAVARSARDAAREGAPAASAEGASTAPPAPGAPTVSIPARSVRAPDAPLLCYTDGGCRGNPGPGGWGFVLVHVRTGATLQACGGEAHTTNNRMEMLAAIAALESLTQPGQHLEIRSDSAYLVDLASKWMESWKRRGWVRHTGDPVANLDLVRRLDELCAAHRVRWTHVRGHAGEPGNELADRLTNRAMDAVVAGRDPAFRARSERPPFEMPKP